MLSIKYDGSLRVVSLSQYIGTHVALICHFYAVGANKIVRLVLKRKCDLSVKTG